MAISTDYADAYFRLRTLLDSVQTNALSYCFDSPDVGERINRMSAVESELMEVIDKIGAKGPGCRPGYNNCDGVCVPYTCPIGESTASAS